MGLDNIIQVRHLYDDPIEIAWFRKYYEFAVWIRTHCEYDKDYHEYLLTKENIQTLLDYMRPVKVILDTYSQAQLHQWEDADIDIGLRAPDAEVGNNDFWPLVSSSYAPISKFYRLYSLLCELSNGLDDTAIVTVIDSY